MTKIIENAGDSWTDKSIDVLEIFSEAHKKDFNKYSLANPHPGFGKDPNILNEYGHTEYPKRIFSKIENQKVTVNNPTEEEQHTGKKGKEQKPAKIKEWS